MRLRDRFTIGMLLAASVVWLAARPSFGQFDDLMLRVPRGANALVLIDVDGVFNSPMAISKGWKASFERKWSEQPILLPPEAKRFVLASHLDPLNNLRSTWEAAVIDLATPVPLTTIARAEGGYLDSIDSTQIVWTPSHAYFVQFDSQLLGVAYPDDRQAVARWIATTKTAQSSPLSPYLAEAAKRLRSAGQIVLAVDLANVAQPHKLDQWLKQSGLLKDRDLSPMVVAQTLSTLKGVTLTIKFESQPMAEARIEFAGKINILKPIARDLVQAAMSRVGIPIEDSHAWKVTVDYDAIVLRGFLTEKGLRQISGFLELPTTKFSTLAKESEKKEDPRQATIDASMRYYKTMAKLIDDLKGGLNTDAKSAWYEKTARKIDQMPILHVDDELLAFGANTARALRQTAERGRDIGRANSANQVAAIASYGNYYDNGYSSGYYNSAGALPSMQIQANNASSQNRTRGQQAINDGLADVRRKMTKKYQVEF